MVAQLSGHEIVKDRGAWHATVHGSQSQTRLSDGTTTATLLLSLRDLPLLFAQHQCSMPFTESVKLRFNSLT